MTIVKVDRWHCGVPGYDGTRVTDVAELVETLDANRHQPVLILAGPGTAARIARTGRAISGHRDAGVFVLDAHPTRRWLLEHLLGALPPDELQHAAAVVDYARHFISTKALVTSVTKVESPSPGLGQHVRSWFPGSWFEIDLDAGTVERRPEEDWDLSAAQLVATTGSAGWQEHVSGIRWPAFGFELEGPADDRPWRAARWLEVSSLLYTADQVVNQVRQTPLSAWCAQCGRSVLGTACAFCGLELPRWAERLAAPDQYGEIAV